jgi:TolB-like protein/tetratricopeptide (TPR) repeat protein
MANAQGDGPTAREALERVLSSGCFARSEGLSRLLRHLVERQLEGRASELKETLIGVEVYGRKPDYDPKLDSTVRSEMARLRARLSRYYSTEGSQDRFVIELRKGSYVPSFRQLEPTHSAKEPRPRQLWLAACLAGFGVAVAAIAGWLLHRNQPIPIAVLPLVDLSKDQANGYIADGISSEIISELSIIEGLTVRSQTSSFALKGKSSSVQDAGQQLAADYILEGSLVRDGSQLRIDTRLVRTRDDVPVWSEKFERDWADVLHVQDEISRGIVNSLRLKLGGGRRRYETSVEAYDLYLRARALATHRFPGDSDVISLFEGATAKDPSLAPAFAGLAGAYAYQSFITPNGRDRADELSKMRAAAERAIQLDPLLAEAHSALGTAYARNAQWEQAEVSLRRAIQIDPNLSIAHDNLTWFFLFPLGRLEEAIKEARTEVKLDPLSPMAHYLLAETLTSAGRYDEAVQQCEKLPREFVFTGDCLGRARLGQGRTTEALRALETANSWGYLAYAYEKTARRDEVEKLLANAPLAYPNRQGHFQYALVYAGMNDKDRTIDQLERWAGVGPVRIGFTLTAPEFAFVRADPRIKTLRKKVGLPE